MCECLDSNFFKTTAGKQSRSATFRGVKIRYDFNQPGSYNNIMQSQISSGKESSLRGT